MASLLGFVLAVVTLFASGSGWDTPYEIELANGVLHNLPPGLQAAYDATPYLFEFYGTLNTGIVEHIGGVFTPGFALDPLDHTVYLWLGAWNILIGIAGVAGLSYAVARALSSAVAGWLLAALVMTTPLWVGHLSMNIKDVPTTVGLSLVSAGLILAWLPAPRRYDAALSVALIALGTAELLGSRASGTVIIGVLVVGSWVLSLFRRRVVATSFVGLIIGLGLVWLQSPFARRGMVRWLADAATTSNINPSQLRFAGSDISSGALPLTYIPGWFLAQLPLLTTLLLVTGTVVAVLAVIGRLPGLGRRDLYPLTPVLIQGVLLPGVIAASHVIIYDAARHVLFALPAFMVLAGPAADLGDRPWRSRPLAEDRNREPERARGGGRAVRRHPLVSLRVRVPQPHRRSRPLPPGLGTRLLGPDHARGHRSARAARRSTGSACCRAPTLRSRFGGVRVDDLAGATPPTASTCPTGTTPPSLPTATEPFRIVRDGHMLGRRAGSAPPSAAAQHHGRR